MQKKYVLPSLCLIVMFSFQSFSQIKRCSTDEYFEQLKAQDPGLEMRVEAARKAAREFLENHQGAFKQSGALITVPVVVHVMHNGTAVGTGANISDAQILSQITVLNEDYQALNTDLSGVPSHFSSMIGNPGLEFCMALFDPEGNPTDGIDRVSMGSGSWNDSRKDGTSWDNTKYLNIWTAPLTGGTLGYATFPGTSPTQDGVVIDYRYFGRTPANPFNSDFDLGRTATHEIGHWLSLEHTFQGGCSGTSSSNCANSGDRICDTPPTASANYGCNLSTNRNTCTETPVDLPDMWMNFLDYMDDACLFMFTQDQVNVMISTLNTSRAGIKSSTACQSQNLFTYGGQVVNASTGSGVPDAKIVFYSSTFTFETSTDASGNFSTPNFREGTYSIYAGKWGYMTKEFSQGMLINDLSSPMVIPIDSGFYYDDFILNYGWLISGNASTGMWERDIPVGTSYQGDNCNPGQDVNDDFGDKCFVTGNGGGQAGNDDVDDGNTVLTSPIFDLSSYNEPYIHYYRWFYNGGGTGTPNDELAISISNGNTTAVIETLDVNTANSNQWNQKSIRVQDYITLTSNMRFILETGDLQASGHLVEAALDKFLVVDSMPNTAVNISAVDNIDFQIYPNPAKNQIFISLDLSKPAVLDMDLFDATGKLIQSKRAGQLQKETLTVDVNQWAEGIYWIRLKSQKETVTRRFTIVR